MKKFTLNDLLNSSDVENFDLSNKLGIYVISSSSMWDRLIAEREEYFINEVPLHLLEKEVYIVYYSDNAIEVFK